VIPVIISVRGIDDSAMQLLKRLLACSVYSTREKSDLGIKLPVQRTAVSDIPTSDPLRPWRCRFVDELIAGECFLALEVRARCLASSPPLIGCLIGCL
jgi:hypothetical protein